MSSSLNICLGETAVEEDIHCRVGSNVLRNGVYDGLLL